MNSTTTTAGAIALRAWLNENETTARKFANANGLSPRSVQQWLAGHCAPRMDKARAVQVATGGTVDVSMWSLRG
jgi:DNA-binding transcriptional regulator YdaS (Cro superfamily)